MGRWGAVIVVAVLAGLLPSAAGPRAPEVTPIEPPGVLAAKAEMRAAMANFLDQHAGHAERLAQLSDPVWSVAVERWWTRVLVDHADPVGQLAFTSSTTAWGRLAAVLRYTNPEALSREDAEVDFVLVGGQWKVGPGTLCALRVISYGVCPEGIDGYPRHPLWVTALVGQEGQLAEGGAVVAAVTDFFARQSSVEARLARVLDVSRLRSVVRQVAMTRILDSPLDQAGVESVVFTGPGLADVALSPSAGERDYAAGPRSRLYGSMVRVGGQWRLADDLVCAAVAVLVDCPPPGATSPARPGADSSWKDVRTTFARLGNVVVGGPGLIAAGNRQTCGMCSEPFLSSSVDAVHWIPADLSLAAITATRTIMAGLVTTPNGWVALGYEEDRGPSPPSRRRVTWRSTDGVHWDKSTSPDSTTSTEYAVWFAGRLISFGSYPSPPGPAWASRVWSSADGLVWTPAGKEPAFDNFFLGAVASLGDHLIAIGYRMLTDTVVVPSRDRPESVYGSAPMVLTSTDGQHWTRETDPPGTGEMRDLAVRGRIVVASGTDGDRGALWRSPDSGETWQRITDTPAINVDTSQQPGCVTEGPAGFILGATTDRQGPPRIWTSPDGRTWEPHTAPRVSHLCVRVTLGSQLVSEEFYRSGRGTETHEWTWSTEP